MRDQLISVQENATTLGMFYYDYQGMRVAKDMGGQIVRYSYDGKSVLTQSDINGQTIAKYEYGPDQLLSMLHVAEGRQFYLFDALGSVSNLTNTSGTVQARYQYDAFGNMRAEAGSSFNRFTFTGHEKDTETGLYYFKARFYDPDTGRFLNQDAYLGDVNTPPSLHRYLYAYANPVVYVDLYGYSSWIATKKEFDQTGEELYAEGHVAGAALVAVGSAFYELGTGYFTGGQFDDVNQAITDNDTLEGAAKQYGTGMVESAKESARVYVEESALKATGKLALKVGCGRARSACATVSNMIDKATGKGGDVKTTVEGPKLDAKMKEPGTPEMGFGAKSGGGAGQQRSGANAKAGQARDNSLGDNAENHSSNGSNEKKLSSHEKGKLGVEASRKKAIENNEKILGEEVTLKLEDGSRTKVDILVEKPDGNLKAIECKNGPCAKLTDNQEKAKVELPKQGGEFRGKRAEQAGFESGTKSGPIEYQVDRHDLE